MPSLPVMSESLPRAPLVGVTLRLVLELAAVAAVAAGLTPVTILHFPDQNRPN